MPVSPANGGATMDDVGIDVALGHCQLPLAAKRVGTKQRDALWQAEITERRKRRAGGTQRARKCPIALQGSERRMHCVTGVAANKQ